MLKITFISISTLLILTISTGRIFIFDCKHSQYMNLCGILMAALFALYTICAFAMIFFIHNTGIKLIFVLLGISPYIIGNFTTYKTLNFSTFIQLIVLLYGIFYVSGT